ncbi:MAG: EamA family transporter [Rhodospirillales bacterium CG15_BIG_FIL_POST_REV_8_21_14_020_66_15]|nr:MAG: EamA family transporter [Rhodospirillales bacterium CG15_BIG_FIL_POST_REV_8_21_14_020_66_15]
METWVLAPVLLAAALHAGWNLLVKMRGDKLVMMGVIDAGHGLLALPLLFFFPFPNLDAWPFIVASAVLHVGYKLFLVRAYVHGDMGVVYPIARGMAPALVALGAFVFAGESLSPAQLAAIIAIAAAISGLTFANGWRDIPLLGLAFAVGTAMFIASYTVVDGIGGRLAGSAHAYALWMFVTDAAIFTAVVLARRRRLFLTTAREYWRPGLTGAAMSMAAYWIVIWAMSITPMAPVSAVRETSVLFAALLAGFVLKEGRVAVRLAAAAVIVGGVVGLQF